MQKVQCNKCGLIGYTASPDYVSCECGGKLKVISEALEIVSADSQNRLKDRP